MTYPTEIFAQSLVDRHFPWLEEEDRIRHGQELAGRFSEVWAVMVLRIAEESNQHKEAHRGH